MLRLSLLRRTHFMTTMYKSKQLKLIVGLIILFNLIVISTLVSSRLSVYRKLEQLHKDMENNTPLELPDFLVSPISNSGPDGFDQSIIDMKKYAQSFIDRGKLPKIKSVLLSPSSPSSPLFEVPQVPYSNLSDDDRILNKLNEYASRDDKHWLTESAFTNYKASIQAKDFLPEKWTDNPVLFYDPRFTLSVYLSEIYQQIKNNNRDIVVPFAWSDWVNLTMLNQEFTKPEFKRKTCEDLKSTHDATSKYPFYCINNHDISEKELQVMKLPSRDYVPGFAVRRSPTNRASSVTRQLEGKSHLLTYASNPLSLIFLNKDGPSFSAKIEGKQRIADGELYVNYLKNKNIDLPKDSEVQIVIDPVEEFKKVLAVSNPSKSENEIKAIPNSVVLSEEPFIYSIEDKMQELKEYNERLSKLRDMVTNELTFDHKSIADLRLQRHEKQYFDGLNYYSQFENGEEPVYFRLAKLYREADGNYDMGWFYDWRFFNGPLKSLKSGRNLNEAYYRERIIFNRLIRNWFRFTQEKNITSWITESSLLSWYWNGQLTPLSKTAEIHMPVNELFNFAYFYNQSLVIEDITEGFGQYFIDCSTFIHHRGQFTENSVDMKFIDINTGSYLSISGIAKTNETVTEKYLSRFGESTVDNIKGNIYNTRHPHFYRHDDISPLSITLFEGTPVFIPNNVQSILGFSYSQAINRYHNDGYFFSSKLNLWLHLSKLEFIFNEMDENEYKLPNGLLRMNKISDMVENFSSEQILRILEKHEDVLLEYYLTKKSTDIHVQELPHIFNCDNNKCDFKEMKSIKDISQRDKDMKYTELKSKFQFGSPVRKSIFEYEHNDVPKHHIN